MTGRHTLGSACAQIVDCEHRTAPIDPNGEYFAVGTPAMKGNVINYKEARRISKDTFESWARRLLPRAGDLLFAREAPVGPIVRIPATENVAPGQRTVLLRPDPDIVDSSYLYYLLSSPLQQDLLTAKGGGSTVAHLNVADVRSFELPDLPPVDEQRTIAGVLGTLDEKIATNAKMLPTANQLVGLLLANRSPSIPLSEVVMHRKRTFIPLNFGDDEVAHFSLPAFDTGCRPELALPSVIKSSKFAIERPCVLVSKLNPRFPRIWDIQKLPGQFAVASTEFLVLESKYSTSSVLWAILSQSSFSASLQSKVAGTSGSHQRVRPGDLLATEVIDPRALSSELQDQLNTLGQCIALRNDESATLAAMRDVLLPQLMSGKIRVKDAEKTVEEVL